MARLPVVGSDEGTWGTLLNEYLEVEHSNATGVEGTHKAITIPDTAEAASGLTLGADTNLYRSAADTLKTDDSFIVGGSMLSVPSGTAVISGVVTASNYKRGTGSPEASVTGSVGDLYLRTDGSTGTTLYVKESGTGNTGWVAVAAGGGSSYYQTLKEAGTPLTQRAGANFTGTDFDLTDDAGNNETDIALASNVARKDSDNTFSASQSITNNGGKTTLALTDTTADVGLTIGGDTNLYRSGADTIRTDDTLIIGTPGTTAGSAVTIDGTQSLTNKKLGSLTANGFVKTSGSDGTLSVDTNGYQELAGITWTIQSSVSDSAWRTVAYGSGVFVAVAQSSTAVMISQDGIIWTSATGAVAAIWLSVAYGNGLFVAVGTAAVMTSPDGITWTQRTAASSNVWASVTYGNDLFVAVSTTGTGNRVMTSPDGITWTSRTSAVDNQWVDVTYGNGLFVAVSQTGTGDRVMTSPDGITWTSRTSAADNQWGSVVYGNGVFVAVSTTGTGNRVMTSPDGITWTSRTSAADNSWAGVTYGNGVFVAVAWSGTGNRVMTSPDGITWTSRTSAADNQWIGVTYGNGVFVAVAVSGTGNRAMTSGKPEAYLDWTVLQDIAHVNINNSFSSSQSIVNNGGKTTLALTNTTADVGLTIGGDTNLYRSAANTLTSDDVFIANNYKRGAGDPEGSVTGNVGDIYQRTDGGAGTTFYVKESGTGNTGWAAVSASTIDTLDELTDVTITTVADEQFLVYDSGTSQWRNRAILDADLPSTITRDSELAAHDVDTTSIHGISDTADLAYTNIDNNFSTLQTFQSTITSDNLKRGTGDPEAAVTGAVGDVYQRTDGGTDSTFYVKESGTGNTGWIAVGAGGAGGLDEGLFWMGVTP